MSTLEDLSRHAQRYQLKRIRSTSSSNSSSSGSSSSGYGSILSQDEAEEKEKNKEFHYGSQMNDLDPGQTQNGQSHSNNSSASNGLKLDINNKGMQLLLKMGWIQGNGLGVTQNGRREPIPTPAQTPLLGLGKATQDAYMLSNAISKPKELESLIIAREDEEAKIKREEKVKEIQTRVVEREDRLKTFHCHTCDKGYTTISQFEEHERSYAHHHAKRALEAKEARKATGRSTEAKLDKERKREAKELERMARAAGMSVDSSRASVSIPKPEIIKSGGTNGFKKVSSGWTKLAPPSSAPSTNKAETSTIVIGSQINPTPVPSSFDNKIMDDSNATTRPNLKFKSAGFAPISTVSSSGSSGFKPIGLTNAEPSQIGLTPSSTPSCRKSAPKFVTSSLQAEVKAPSTTIIKESAATPGSTPNEPPSSTINSTAAPPSKFAQIAARLAARKANSALASASSTHLDADKTTNTRQNNPSLAPKSSSQDQYDSEIEKMLDI